jgi:hypothetical protein
MLTDQDRLILQSAQLFEDEAAEARSLSLDRDAEMPILDRRNHHNQLRGGMCENA